MGRRKNTQDTGLAPPPAKRSRGKAKQPTEPVADGGGAEPPQKASAKKSDTEPARDFKVFLEAMRDGKATITRGFAGPPELVFDEELELAVVWNDLNSLAFLVNRDIKYTDSTCEDGTFARKLARLWLNHYEPDTVKRAIGSESDTSTKYKITPMNFSAILLCLRTMFGVMARISPGDAIFSAVVTGVLDYLTTPKSISDNTGDMNHKAYQSNLILMEYNKTLDKAAKAQTKEELDAHLVTVRPMLNGFSHLVKVRIEYLDTTFGVKQRILRMAVSNRSEVQMASELKIPYDPASKKPIQDFLTGGALLTQFLDLRAALANTQAEGGGRRAVTGATVDKNLPRRQKKSEFPSIDDVGYNVYLKLAFKQEPGQAMDALKGIKENADQDERMKALNLCLARFRTKFVPGKTREQEVTDAHILCTGFTTEQFDKLWILYMETVQASVKDLVHNGGTFQARVTDGGEALLPSVTFNESIEKLMHNVFENMTADSDVHIPRVLFHIPAELVELKIGEETVEEYVSGVLHEFMEEYVLKRNAISCLHMYFPGPNLAERLGDIIGKAIPETVVEPIRGALLETLICLLFLAASDWTLPVEFYTKKRALPPASMLFIKTNTPLEIRDPTDTDVMEEVRSASPAVDQAAIPPATSEVSGASDAQNGDEGTIDDGLDMDIEVAAGAETLVGLQTQATGGSQGIGGDLPYNCGDPAEHLANQIMAEVTPNKGRNAVNPTEDEYKEIINELTCGNLQRVQFTSDDHFSVETMLAKFEAEKHSIDWRDFQPILEEMRVEKVSFNPTMIADTFMHAVVQYAYKKKGISKFPSSTAGIKLGLKAFNDRKQAIINEAHADKHRAESRQASTAAAAPAVH